MTPRGRRARIAGTLLVVAGLLFGSAFGDDDHFPFGPFRMYSTTNALNDDINTVRFHAVTATGEEIEPRAQDFGLRPAEVNGQVARFRDDPTLLRHLADAYRRVDPSRPPLKEIHLGYGWFTLRDGVPVSYREETVASWGTL